MQIAILGTGNVGSALARALARAGHSLTLGTRDPAHPAAHTLATATGATLAMPQDAAQSAEVILLALPWPALATTLPSLGPLTGKTVIGCTNPLTSIPHGLDLATGHTDSGAEQVQRLLPGAHVVKTLNQTGAEMMEAAYTLPHRPVQFIAGDNPQAKATAAALLTDLGFDPLDAGPLHRARLLEPFALLWINQAVLRGKGRT
jgi:predicted dinucleotide-binding enzyme